MADILQFGVKFDIEGAKKNALSDIKRLLPELEQALNLTLDFNVSAESIKDLSKSLESIGNKHIDIITPAQHEAIRTLASELEQLTPILNRIEQAATKQSEQIARNLTATTKAAIEEEKLAQAKEKTAQAQAKTTAEAAKAETAVARQALAQEKLSQSTEKASMYTAAEYEALLGTVPKVTKAIEDLEDAFSNDAANQYLERLTANIQSLEGTDVSGYLESASENTRSYNLLLHSLEADLVNITDLQDSLNRAFEDGDIGVEEFEKLSNILRFSGSEIISIKSALEQIGPPAKNAKGEIEQIAVALDVKPVSNWSDAVLEAAKKVGDAHSKLVGLQIDLKELGQTDFSNFEDFIKQQADLEASIVQAKNEYKDLQSTLKTQIQLEGQVTEELVAQEGSLRSLKDQLTKYKAEIEYLNPSAERYKELTPVIQGLEREVETLSRAQGNLALSSRTWGREVTDLTYGIRLFNPTLGILAQRFQRISILGQTWNKVLIATQNGFSITRKAAVSLVGGLTLLGTALVALTAKYIRQYILSLMDAAKEQERFSNSVRDSYSQVASEYANFIYLANGLSKLTEGTEEYIKAKNRLAELTKEYTNGLSDEVAQLTNLGSAIDVIGNKIIESFSQKVQQAEVGKVFDKFGKEWTKASDELYNVIASHSPELVEQLYQSLTTALIDSRGIITKEVREILSYFDTVEAYVDQSTGRIHRHTINLVTGYANQFGKIYSQLSTNIDIVENKSNAVLGAIRNVSDTTKDWVKQLRASGIYTDDIIKNFKDTNDAAIDINKRLDDTREKLDSLRKLKATGSGVISADIDLDIEKAEQLETALLALKIIFGTISAPTDDTRLQQLKAELAIVKQAEDAYRSFQDVFTTQKAAKETNKLYDGLIDKFTKLPRDIQLQFDGSDYERAINWAIEKADYLTEKEKIQLRAELSKRDVDRIKRDMQKLIKDLNADIKRQQTASKFFEDIFASTGDYNLAQNLTFSVTGQQIENIRKQTQNAISDILQANHYVLPVTVTGDVDYAQLDKIINALPKEVQSAVSTLSESMKQSDIDFISSLVKNTQEFQSFEDRRTIIAAKAAKERADAEERYLLGQFGDLETELGAAEAAYSKFIDAINKKEIKSQAAIDLEEIKISDDFIKAFEDLSRVGNDTLNGLVLTLEEYREKSKEALSPTELAELTRLLEKLRSEVAERDPFSAITTGIDKYRTAREKLNKALKSGNAVEAKGARDEMAEGLSQATEGAEKLASAFGKIENAFNSVINLIEEFAEAFGAEFNDETRQIIKSIGMAFSIVSAAIGVLTVALLVADIQAKSLIATLTPLLIIAAALAAVFAIFTIDWSGNTKRANKQIEKQQKIIDDLTASYRKLERARKSALGVDLAITSEKQLLNAEEQIAAKRAQIEAERSKKRRKRDKDQIKQWEEDIAELYETIEDLHEDFARTLLGTDIASAARDFASSWLDARLSAQDTFAQIQEDFKGLIQNLIVETLFSKIISDILKDVFKDVEDIYKGGVLDEGRLKDYINQIPIVAEQIDNNLSSIIESFPEIVDALSKAETNLTGISKAVASITEEQADILGGLFNSFLLESIETRKQLERLIYGGGGVIGLSDYLAQSMINQSEILATTRAINTVAEDIAQSNRDINSSLNSVVTARSGGYSISTHIQN